MGRASFLIVSMCLGAAPAAGQVRTVVVPAEPGVVIAPRSAPPSRVHLAPAGRSIQRFVPVAPTAETLAGPSAWVAAGAALAAGAAALLAGAGGGGSGGGTASATASTAVTRR